MINKNKSVFICISVAIIMFIGFKERRTVIVEPTLKAEPQVARAKCEQALAQAREMAQVF
jgi:hypothetical protein